MLWVPGSAARAPARSGENQEAGPEGTTLSFRGVGRDAAVGLETIQWNLGISISARIAGFADDRLTAGLAIGCGQVEADAVVGELPRLTLFNLSSEEVLARFTITNPCPSNP